MQIRVLVSKKPVFRCIHLAKWMLVTIVLFVSFRINSYSQENQDQNAYLRQRTIFIYNFIRQTSWDNIYELNQFKIGVLGNDPIEGELRLMGENRTIVGLPIVVEKYDQINDIKHVQLLYVNNKFDYDIKEVLNQIVGKNTLLISEGYAFNESMVNIISRDNVFQFEINEDLLNAENFQITSSLRKLAITSSERWQQLYKSTEKDLENARKKSEEQRNLLDLQKNAIAQHQALLEKQGKLLNEHKSTILSQSTIINNQKSEIEIQKEDLDAIQNRLAGKAEELESVQQYIDSREKQIKQQDSILFAQQKAIDNQKELIDNQGETLNQQKHTIMLQKQRGILIMIIAALAIIMLFILLKSYRNKKSVNEQLVSLNEEKNKLIGVVSHDLRNPIHQIKGLISLMELDGGSGLNTSQKGYIHSIGESCDRLIDMIKRILDVNAIESKKINIMMEELILSSVVSDVVQDFRLMAQKKSISIDDIYPNAEIKTKIDKNYFIQVLENIVSNAIKYSESNTEITVSVTEQEEKVIVAVKDQGPGISEEDRQKMFGTYQKLSAKPTGGEDSYGLGLSIAKKYIEAMHGEISCESELGHGSTFKIEFKKA